uniref:Uncharacterized protein n=1 Tax=Timema cristinae TaxID=61476 RepID=A0A7R9H2X7_TIMCR|nr:unnamed protein product [Timema cristinae]
MVRIPSGCNVNYSFHTDVSKLIFRHSPSIPDDRTESWSCLCHHRMVLRKITVPLYRDYEVTTAVREVGIRSGYRPECSSALQCVASLFRNTNETANFWSHFLPSVYFTSHLLSSFRAPLSLHIHRAPLSPFISTGLLSLPSYPQGSSLPSYPQGSSLPSYTQGSSLPSYTQGSSLPSYTQGSSLPSYPQGSTGCPKAVLLTQHSHKSKVTINFPTVASTDSSHWPYLGYLLTVTAYLWASCGAHAFCSLSLRARNICYFVDYLALSVFSFGSAMLYVSYSFPQHLHNTRSVYTERSQSYLICFHYGVAYKIGP